MPAPDVHTIDDIMTGDVLFMGPRDPMARARDTLTTTGFHAIPIIENDEPLGMVTLADCQNRDDEDALGEIMAGPPVCIDVNASVSEAASLMRANYVHHLIVTEGDRHTVVGVLSSYDLLAMLAD